MISQLLLASVLLHCCSLCRRRLGTWGQRGMNPAARWAFSKKRNEGPYVLGIVGRTAFPRRVAPQRLIQAIPTPPADRSLAEIPGRPTAGLVGRAKCFRLQLEGVRGCPNTGRSGERYGSYDQTDISENETSTGGGRKKEILWRLLGGRKWWVDALSPKRWES
jgi:hypothetical protein